MGQLSSLFLKAHLVGFHGLTVERLNWVVNARNLALPPDWSHNAAVQRPRDAAYDLALIHHGPLQLS